MTRVKVVKKAGVPVVACRLGDGSALEERLIESGALARRADGRYEVFSREAVNGRGEIAEAGSYIKVDGGGRPYPNAAGFFLENHEPAGDGYVQRPRALEAWREGEPLSDEMRFLLDTGRLTIDRECPERWFSARLWGTLLSAAKDAVVVFYSVRRGPDGAIEDAQFALVAADEFRRTYDILS